MPDPTDRQRAEAMIPMCFQTSDRHGLISAIAAYIEQCEQRARREGWDAGREAAAKWHDDAAAIAEARKQDAINRHHAQDAARFRLERLEHQQHARTIRALLPPEAPAAQDASDKEEK